MCMWFGFNPAVNFCHFSTLLTSSVCADATSTSPKFYLFFFVTFSTLRTSSFCDLSFYENVVTVGTLWAQLLIQFYTDLFELCTCFRHGLEMCIWFGYNPWINFCHFFHFVNFVIFWPQILWKSRDSGYLVSAAPHTILYQSLWNFAHVFAMVWRCARDLDIILELIFVTFSTLWTLSFLTSDSMKVYRQWLPCKRNSLYNFMPVFMQLCTSFFPWFEDVHVVWI